VPNDPIRPSPVADTGAVSRLGAALEEFAATLTAREYAILRAIVEQAMPPHERMRRRAPEDVLDESERRIVDRLKSERG
jgi:hypothetical protein